MTDDLIFYTNPMSRGRIVRWMLEEVGATYKTEYLDYGDAMKSEAYLSINPMGKVPAIVHNGVVVTETAAICAHLADTFPAAGLAPTNDQRGEYYRWLFFAAGPIEAAVSNKALNLDPPEESRSTLGYGDFATVMDTLESKLSSGDYLVAGRFTAADVYLGAQVGWGLLFGTIDKRPVFETYWAKLFERDAYRRATELDDKAQADQGNAI